MIRLLVIVMAILPLTVMSEVIKVESENTLHSQLSHTSLNHSVQSDINCSDEVCVAVIRQSELKITVDPSKLLCPAEHNFTLYWDQENSAIAVSGYEVVYTSNDVTNTVTTSNKSLALTLPKGLYSFKIRSLGDDGSYSDYIKLINDVEI